jgi:predicted methyltransferase
MRHARAVLAMAMTMACAVASIAVAAPVPAPIARAVHDSRRTPAFVGRDAARHPAAELAFFGLRPNATVVEIDPGAGYWTEILAPLLHAHGMYYAAVPADADDAKGVALFQAKLAADPARFGRVHVTQFGQGQYAIAPPGSADFVLTFRNLHNWMEGGYAPEALAAFYTALKPGGVLGMEEHRGSNSVPQDPKAESGYVRQDYAVQLAKQAGFELVGSSEMLANPKDTKNWPKGVWTLPPTFALGTTDHAKYAAIGEADNFLLLFRKPVH